MPHVLLNKLKKRLQEPLPGKTAQNLLAPMHRPNVSFTESDADKIKMSAVMILFCVDEQGHLFLPLIQRPSYNGVHSGQISLPGGKFEKNDGTLEMTAIRECYEEIGIKDHIEVIGKISELYIPVSGFLVEPYIGFHKIAGPTFLPQLSEVERVIKLYIRDLLNDENIKTGELHVRENIRINAPYFPLEDKQIWGATAMILSELRVIMKTIA